MKRSEMVEVVIKWLEHYNGGHYVGEDTALSLLDALEAKGMLPPALPIMTPLGPDTLTGEEGMNLWVPEDAACADCGTRENVHVGFYPYTREVHDQELATALCPACYKGRCDDI